MFACYMGVWFSFSDSVGDGWYEDKGLGRYEWMSNIWDDWMMGGICMMGPVG